MARPFSFKLEKVLEFRQQAEDHARLAFSQARQAEREQRDAVQKIEIAMEHCLQEMADLKQVTQSELWLWSGWRNRLELDRKAALARLAELEKRVEQRRQELLTRSTERKLLEKLRSKQARRHEQDEQHKEQNAFDEAATLRYGRTPY